jgi:hypothetical protein
MKQLSIDFNSIDKLNNYLIINYNEIIKDSSKEKIETVKENPKQQQFKF